MEKATATEAPPKREASVLTPAQSVSRKWQATAYDANGKEIQNKELLNDDMPENFKALLYSGKAVVIVHELKHIAEADENGPQR